MGRDCSSVGRAVASNTRGPRFESRHRKIFKEHLFTVNCIVLKRQNKRKRGRELPIFKNNNNMIENKDSFKLS